MTALKKYERLESLGLWKESSNPQRREVIVSFGASSLVLSDANGKPLSHWSLAAVRTLSHSEKLAIYAPDSNSDETLEIDDSSMIEAIEEVRRVIRRIGPHPGRLRWVITGGMVAATVAFAMLWLPSISADYATRVLPKAASEQIGLDVLKQTASLTGLPCSESAGLTALTNLEKWLLPDGGHIHVVDMGARFSAHLPGGHILINRILVEENSGPEVAAGFVMMEKVLAEQSNPMTEMFRNIGTRGTLTFLANGVLPQSGIADYARKQLTQRMQYPDDTPLLAAFAKAALTSSPFAYALDASGKTTAQLIEQDPALTNYFPQLTDADWIALQSICGD